MGLVAWVFVGGALVLVVLAAFVGHELGRRRARRASAAGLTAAEQRVAELEAARAGLEARDRAAVVEGERWRCAASDLEASLADAEQEKTRLDYELRQVGLAASRVPHLEQNAFELGRAEASLADARRRLTELESVAAELELREQFIDSLQRELTHRDERVLVLEQRIDELVAPKRATGGLVPAESAPLLPAGAHRAAPARLRPELTGSDTAESGPMDPGAAPLPTRPALSAPLEADRVAAGRPGPLDPLGASTNGRAPRHSPDDEAPSGRADAVAADGWDDGGPDPADEARDPSAAADADEDTVEGDDADTEADPAGQAPVGRALQQALHGLGVRSFADLGVFDPSTGKRT